MQVQRRRCSLEWRHSPLFASWHTASWILASPRCNDFPFRRLLYEPFLTRFILSSFFSPFLLLLLLPPPLLLHLLSFLLLSGLLVSRRDGTRTGDVLCARDVNCSRERRNFGKKLRGILQWRMVRMYSWTRFVWREAIFEQASDRIFFFLFLILNKCRKHVLLSKTIGIV